MGGTSSGPVEIRLLFWSAGSITAKMAGAGEALQEVKTCPTWESCREELLSFHSAERHIAAIRHHPRPPRLDLGSTRSRRIRASEMAPFSGHHVKNEVEPNQYTPFYMCVCVQYAYIYIYIYYTLYYYII